MKHVPVLLEPVMNLAFDQGSNSFQIWDGTFGRGGHTRAFLSRYPSSQVLGTDRDWSAVQFGEQELQAEIQQQRLKLKHFNFHDFEDLSHLSREEGFDCILLDLGVSSPQLDEPSRGFSFYHDGPLDMRMDQTQNLTAADIVNQWSESELIQLFQELGEVPRPQKVVKEILKRREAKRMTTTQELSLLIERTFGWRKKGKHPATSFFLALRLEVNQELSELHRSLLAIMERALKPKGRLLVLTFHSSEDRIVKWLFKKSEHLGKPVNKKVIAPEREEILLNPRSRSAKLRVFQKGG